MSAILFLIVSLCILSVHSQAGGRCNAGGSSGTCINTNTQRCNGQIFTGRCPGAANIRCCVSRGNNGGARNPPRNGGNNGGGSMPPRNGGNNGGGNGGGSSTPAATGGDLGSFPTSLTTNGYTYRGRDAQVLHSLKRRFGANPTTYASHSDGPTKSADLWTAGATGGRDNRNMPSMNNLADYCAANLRNLGLKYVIWKQRINSGSGWRAMGDRGSLTQNHYDHVHITFTGSSCTGKNCANARAVGLENEQLSTSPANTSSSTPAWAIALIVISVFAAIGTIVVAVLVSRKLYQY